MDDESNNNFLPEDSLAIYQEQIDLIRRSRLEVSSKLQDHFSNWYNNFIAICFAAGIGLLALLSISGFTTSQLFFLWLAVGIFIINGLCSLLWRKALLENDATELTMMGYEEEYYLTIMKNEVITKKLTNSFNKNVFMDAKQKLMNTANNNIKKAYEKTDSVDTTTDIMVAFFVLAIIFTALGIIQKTNFQIFAGLLLFSLYSILLAYLKSTIPKAQKALDIRNKWESLIQAERDRRINVS